MDSYFELKSHSHDEFSKLNLSYEIKDLHFGLEETADKKGKMQELIRDLDLSEELFNNHIDHNENNYNAFIAGFWMELIPYTFVDNRTGFSFRSLQHSFNRKIKVR